MDLSIVIPALNEGGKIEADVRAAADFLDGESLRGEVLVVDDGSDDDTAEVARDAPVPTGVERRVVSYHPHRGKGYAVRAGMVQTRGRIIMFADSGLCVPFENALRGMALIGAGECEVAHGSRKLSASLVAEPQPLFRRALSRAFRTAVKTTMGIPREMTDTQCGFKLYRGDPGRELFAACRSVGFAFDIEVLLRARQRGLKVKEFPVEWRCDVDSRLRPGRNAFTVMKELVAIRLALASEKRN